MEYVHHWEELSGNVSLPSFSYESLTKLANLPRSNVTPFCWYCSIKMTHSQFWCLAKQLRPALQHSTAGEDVAYGAVSHITVQVWGIVTLLLIKFTANTLRKTVGVDPSILAPTSHVGDQAGVRCFCCGLDIWGANLLMEVSSPSPPPLVTVPLQ